MTPCTGQGAAKPCLRRHQCQRYIAYTNMAASPAPVAVYDKPLASECWRIIPVIKDDRPTRCKYNDCGWCYAPDGVSTNAVQGQCRNPKDCQGKSQEGE